MKYSAIILAAMLMTLTACVSSGPKPLPDNGFTHTSATSAASMDSERGIVLAIANPLEQPAPHAGSDLLNYTPSTYYGAGQRAISTLTALKQRYGLREVTGWPIKPLGLYCIVLEPPPGMTRDALLKMLAKDERVQLAEPLHDYSVYAEKPPEGHRYNDPYVNLQRGFVETDAAVAHNLSQGNGVRVAVVDTGIETTHPDLQGRIRDTNNLVDGDTSASSHDRHGTEVAGVIAADGDNHQGIVGIAPKAILSIYKACWYPPGPNVGARCNSFTLAKALVAITDTNIRIVNMSLGGPADPLLNKLLAHLLEQGRIVVAALPPDGSVSGFPDNVPGVIVVRVSAASVPPLGILNAPGHDILTSQPGGGYDFTSGSSMSTAHVSGIVALLLSIAPRLDAHTVHDLLLRTSKISNGIVQVNAAAALMALHSREKIIH